mmetsp:Transcript_19070/g.53380  ORF Transcript_19070/g.53380 Transcript_19070/m.53380 type:complete len:94 (-) Transcript_19070:1147-1428(-)
MTPSVPAAAKLNEMVYYFASCLLFQGSLNQANSIINLHKCSQKRTSSRKHLHSKNSSHAETAHLQKYHRQLPHQHWQERQLPEKPLQNCVCGN